jgi:Domain of unknown function DUF29
MSNLYEQDFYSWTQEQAVLLRQGKLTQLDVENLIEEIESLGRQERRELVNRLVVLLHHLLKWEFQPEYRSRSWEATIKIQRLEVAKLLEQNPSLRPYVTEAIADAYLRAIVEVYGETGISAEQMPVACPYSFEQIGDIAFFPGSND